MRIELCRIIVGVMVGSLFALPALAGPITHVFGCPGSNITLYEGWSGPSRVCVRMIRAIDDGSPVAFWSNELWGQNTDLGKFRYQACFDWFGHIKLRAGQIKVPTHFEITETRLPAAVRRVPPRQTYWPQHIRIPPWGWYVAP